MYEETRRPTAVVLIVRTGQAVNGKKNTIGNKEKVVRAGMAMARQNGDGNSRWNRRSVDGQSPFTVSGGRRLLYAQAVRKPLAAVPGADPIRSNDSAQRSVPINRAANICHVRKVG